jgi:predicted nucleic acid-binding protein
MSAERVFIDTNVLYYSCDRFGGGKRERARVRLDALWEADAGALSLQVLQEFFYNCVGKLAEPNALAVAREALNLYRPWLRQPTTIDTVMRATQLMELARLSFWDALIVASAAEAGAGTLLTEGLTHGQIIAGVRIENPFLAG